MNKKIKIHIRNNHWKHGCLPCDPEGEKNVTITKEIFETELNKSPELRDKIEYLDFLFYNFQLFLHAN